MTVKELSQLYWLTKEIEQIERRLTELECEASSPRSPRLDGMPRGSDGEDRITALIAMMAELQTELLDKRVMLIAERTKLERYIGSIEDSQTRLVFRLRFIDCLSWFGVADAVGGGNTEDSVKKRCYRYLKDERAKEKCCPICPDEMC